MVDGGQEATGRRSLNDLGMMTGENRIEYNRIVLLQISSQDFTTQVHWKISIVWETNMPTRHMCIVSRV